MPRTLELKWQWPAGREPHSTCHARITKIYPDKKLFDSPSRGDFIPDPFVIEADVSDGIEFQSISLRLPEVEIKNLQTGDLVELDLIDTHVCTAVRKL